MGNPRGGCDRPSWGCVAQHIPKTAYVLESVRANGAQLTYSIDGGQTYSEQSMIEVTQPDGTIKMEPAPAEAYTHVQWDYSESLKPMASGQAVYEVAVQSLNAMTFIMNDNSLKVRLFLLPDLVV